MPGDRFKPIKGDSFTTRKMQALLKVKKTVEDPHRITAPVDFNPHLPNISQILKKHHKAMLKNAPYLGEMFKSPPMASYRQPPNLRRMVCKSKLFPV